MGTLRFLSCWAMVACWSVAAFSAEFHVTPDADGAGDGSSAKPWILSKALSHPAALKPGDTIYLHGDAYRGTFTSSLKGTKDAPITVRQAPGERVIIECIPSKPNVDPLFTVQGEYAVFQGFELFCPDPNRGTQITGSWPGDMKRGGINCLGANIKFINLVVHDCGCGFGFWSNGEGGEIYGCLIYNNGWKGPDRGHGHAIYTQNKIGIKRIVDCVMFNQFSYGIHAYGSSRAFLQGFHIEGNVSFSNGCLAGGTRGNPAILVGGDSPAGKITLLNNFTYESNPSITSVQLGYGAVNDNAKMEGNYIVGRTQARKWKSLSFTDNRLIAPDAPLSIQSLPDVAENAYVLRGNQEIKGKPRSNAIFVRPNQYERGRAHIIVYNWEKLPAVSVPLGPVLERGRRYRIVNAQDFFGPTVVPPFVWNDAPVQIPMKPANAARPVGMDSFVPPATEPEFGVFVVLPEATM